MSKLTDDGKQNKAGDEIQEIRSILRPKNLMSEAPIGFRKMLNILRKHQNEIQKLKTSLKKIRTK